MDEMRPAAIAPPYAPTATSLSVTSTAVNSTKPTPVDATIKELTEQLAALTLMMKSNISGTPVGAPTGSPMAPTASASVPATTGNRPERVPRCIMCDSKEHSRRDDCVFYQEAIATGNIKLNDRGRVVFAANGAEIPTQFGKGGMKRIYELTYPPLTGDLAIQSSSRNVTFDDGNYASIGEGHGVRVTTLDFENGIRTDRIIDADVEEKRKRDEFDRTRQTRRRMEESQTPPAASGPTPPTVAPNARSPRADDSKPKYRLQSQLNQTVGTADIGDKIMNTPVMLSIKEILAVSPEMGNYMHEQTRRKRVPVSDTNSDDADEIIEVASKATAVSESTATVSLVTSSGPKPFYALPSGKAAVVLNEQVRTNALLDDGSELNVMSEALYKELEYPIDEDINWKINGYDAAKAEKELEARYGARGDVLGVLHNVYVDVGGVQVKQHIFVVRTLPAGLILGRPWGRMTRAVFANEDDGSYTVWIRSPDGMTEAKFLAAPAQHERNREHVRSREDVGKGLKA